ncbi:hypothetical protein N7497_010533 [Penicillium chrysogenum]|uniref:Uncharacterized protein n=1 Tax=Penicillium chrysogenum TaxID=5076 RepID=A0ABQ8WGL2_PENCH|nr:hypothetical protein N7505_004498 [Penicillium chrysogenum]KAJ6148551.1 hypothetical protein N7497_010533 [Penicillium chrysogenum]
MDSKSGCRPITHQTHAHMSIESDQNRMPDLMASSPSKNSRSLLVLRPSKAARAKNQGSGLNKRAL